VFRAADADALVGVFAAIDLAETAAIAPPGTEVQTWFALPLLLGLVLWLLARGLAAMRGGLW
jgi:hypothetical protein